MAALLALAAPGLARNSETPKSSEQQAAPPPCHSYQQAADGSWIERPCEALGVPTPPQHKSATRKTDERTR
jgi:hypothetical protein